MAGEGDIWTTIGRGAMYVVAIAVWLAMVAFGLLGTADTLGLLPAEGTDEPWWMAAITIGFTLGVLASGIGALIVILRDRRRRK